MLEPPLLLDYWDLKLFDSNYTWIALVIWTIFFLEQYILIVGKFKYFNVPYLVWIRLCCFSASFLDLCITFVHLWYIFEEALHIFLGFQNAFYVEFKATWVMPLIKLFCAICEYFGCHDHVVYMTLIFILLFALIQWNRL